MSPALEDCNVGRKVFNSWLKDDKEFAASLEEYEQRIDDEALELAYREVGLLPLKGKRRKRPVDRALLRDILRRHPRFAAADDKKREAPAAQPIEIKGIEARILLQVVGGVAAAQVTGAGVVSILPHEPPPKQLEGPAAGEASA